MKALKAKAVAVYNNDGVQFAIFALIVLTVVPVVGTSFIAIPFGLAMLSGEWFPAVFLVAFFTMFGGACYLFERDW